MDVELGSDPRVEALADEGTGPTDELEQGALAAIDETARRSGGVGGGQTIDSEGIAKIGELLGELA